MSWSTDNVTVLIDGYRSRPHLYIPKHPDYYNKQKRSLSIKEIIDEMERPYTTENDVKTKWNGIKTTYLIERRRVLDSMKSGIGEAEVHKPKLWYYDLLTFLDEHVQVRKSTSSMEINIDCDPISLDSHASTSCDSVMEYIVSDDGTLLSPPTPQENVHVRGNKQNSSFTPKLKRKRVNSERLTEDAATALQNITNALEKEQEKTPDYLALSFSQRLNGIKNKRRKLLLINKIENLIFEAELEEIDE